MKIKTAKQMKTVASKVDKVEQHKARVLQGVANHIEFYAADGEFSTDIVVNANDADMVKEFLEAKGYGVTLNPEGIWKATRLDYVPENFYSPRTALDTIKMKLGIKPKLIQVETPTGEEYHTLTVIW